MTRVAPLVLLLLAGAAGARSIAPANPGRVAVMLDLRNHRFNPPAIIAHAGETILVQLINHDAAAEEFDSRDLRLSRLVPAGGRIIFQIGPLQAGDYRFTGEFHPGTARGRVIVGP